MPLAQARSSLARKMSPAEHAFGALIRARLGEDERAREELAALRAIVGDERVLTTRGAEMVPEA